MSYKRPANFNLSQFLSTKVDPMAIPSICVCAAPLTPTAHRSLLILVIAGATAVGGGLITLVVELEVESVVLLLVLSVTIGSAAITDETNNTADITAHPPRLASFFIIFYWIGFANLLHVFLSWEHQVYLTKIR
jgi:hypothetical protein